MRASLASTHAVPTALRLDFTRTKQFVAHAFCPCYARGLASAGDHTIVGLSLPRENRTFQGLLLDEALAKNGSEPRCGLIIVDTNSGDTIAS